jgi:protein TonB
MPLDPSTLIARTTAGDAELSAPRHGLAIAQRRLLTILDQPVPLDELAARPGIQPDRLERDLGRLAEFRLVEIHRPAGASGPMFPTPRRSAASIDLPPPPTPTVAPTLPGTLRLPTAASAAPAPVGIRHVRRGRAVLVGFATLVAVGVAVWLFATPSPEPPPRKAAPSPPPPAVAPTVRSQADATPAPSRSIEQVRALLAPDPTPARQPIGFTTEPVVAPTVATPAAAPKPRVAEAPPTVIAAPAPVADAAPARNTAEPAVLPVAPPPAAPPVPPTQLAAAAPVLQETRIAPLTLTPVTREIPEFPREAVNAGVAQGSVRARLTVDAAGRVTAVDIVDAQPRRVFDRAVMRTLSRWTFEPGASGRTTDIEIAFRRD